MKKRMEADCPLKKQPISSHTRIRCLSVLENVLSNFYIPLARRVDKPYSDQERKLLVRIIKLLTFRIEGNLSKSCLSCRSIRCDFIQLFGVQSYFRLTLPAKHPFCITARTNCLHELVNKLNCFFACQSVPCSVREGIILSRIKKILVHQLRGTSKYDLFKGST